MAFVIKKNKIVFTSRRKPAAMGSYCLSCLFFLIVILIIHSKTSVVFDRDHESHTSAARTLLTLVVDVLCMCVKRLQLVRLANSNKIPQKTGLIKNIKCYNVNGQILTTVGV